MDVGKLQTGTSSIQDLTTHKRHHGQSYKNTESQHTQLKTNKELTKEQMKQAVESANGFIEPLKTNLKFVFHDELNEYYVTVVDPITSEVIKEIPPKKMLDMFAAMTASLGIVIDERI